MKSSLIYLSLVPLLWLVGCAEKRAMVALPPPVEETPRAAESGCADTMATVVFVNTKTVELRLGIAQKTSVREGNTIINNWKNIKTIPIKVGDSSMQILRSGKQFMYTVYGPVSTNVNGLGVVAEEKITLQGCEWRRIELYK
jgi:hypothetical protein